MGTPNEILSQRKINELRDLVEYATRCWHSRANAGHSAIELGSPKLVQQSKAPIELIPTGEDAAQRAVRVLGRHPLPCVLRKPVVIARSRLGVTGAV